MCGFTGYINLENQPLNSRVLKQMIDIQAHRGPDDQGMVGFSFLKTSKLISLMMKLLSLAIYMQVLVLTDYLF